MFFWLIVGMITSFVSHYLIDIIYYNYNFEHVHKLILNERTEIFLFGAILFFIFYILFSSLLGSSILGGSIIIIIAGVIGTVSKYKSILRAEPLYPNELYMIKELPSLMEMIGLKKSILLVLFLISILVLLFIIYRYIIKSKKDSKSFPYMNKGRIIGTIGAIVIIIYVGRFNYPNNLVKKAYSHYATWVSYNQSKNYSDNGFVAGFLYNLKAPPMETPNNYSKKSLEEIYQKYYKLSQNANKNRKDKDLDTNILFVMNESFYDPFNLARIESNIDPLINYREIIKNTTNGNILSPSFGGGTATNEFEVLTGFLMEPFVSQITSPF